jgi:hypothetical protein
MWKSSNLIHVFEKCLQSEGMPNLAWFLLEIHLKCGKTHEQGWVPHGLTQQTCKDRDM